MYDLPYMLPLIVSLLIASFLIVYGWLHRETTTAKFFVMLMVAGFIWVAATLLEMLVPTLAQKLLIANFSFVGIAMLPPLWLAVTLAYTGQHQRFKWVLFILFGVAFVTNVMIWTNDWHHLWRVNPTLETTPFPVVNYDYGLWFYRVHVFSGYVAFFISLIVMFWAMLIAKPAYRQQIFILIVALLIPLTTDTLYILGITPIPNFNPTPIAFSISGLILAWNLFRYHFLDLMPVARDIVIDNIRDSVIVLDTQNRVVDFNLAAQHWLPSTQLIGQSVEQLFPNHSDLVERFKDASTVDTEISLTDEQVWFDLRISPLVRRDGQLMGKVVVLHDITARKQAEDALQTAYGQLLILREIDIDLTHRLDTNYVLMMALDAAVRLSGADSSTISLTENDTITVVAGLGLGADLIGTQLDTENGIVGRVLRQQQAERIPDVHADPDYLALNDRTRAQMALPLVAHDRLLGVINLETAYPQRFSEETFEFMRLLTTRIAVALDNAYAYSEMAQLVEDLDAFSHTVAHDLKNPLGIVLGYAHILAEDFTTLPPGQAQNYLDMVVRGSDKMLNIIDELLLLSSMRRLDEIPTETLDMTYVAREALARLPVIIEKYEGEVVFHEAELWPQAVGYAAWVEEVWANYISNALKYGGRPPLVELGAMAEEDGMVRFWVRDNGPGLEAEQQARVFNKFTRLDETRAQGHGLGLSIAQRIVVKLGGQVSVESEAGQGSTFSFTLPAAQ